MRRDWSGNYALSGISQQCARHLGVSRDCTPSAHYLTLTFGTSRPIYISPNYQGSTTIGFSGRVALPSVSTTSQYFDKSSERARTACRPVVRPPPDASRANESIGLVPTLNLSLALPCLEGRYTVRPREVLHTDRTYSMKPSRDSLCTDRLSG